MKFSSKRLIGAMAVVLLGSVGTSSILAASTNVTVGNPIDAFFPAVVSIQAGDQVVWTWVATFHSSTSGTNGVHGDDNGVPGGLWDSGLITSGLPHTFTNTFSTPGNYAYFCSMHFAAPHFMTGAVLVASSALPPSVSITNPAANAVFAAPASVTIQATASESGGSITNVQFLVGSSVLANKTSPPFSATTNNLSEGSYMLTAIASDGGGATATNSVPISVVTPVTVALTNSSAFSGTNFQFSYAANVGLSYVIERSTGLVPANWVSLVTNVATSNPVVFMDKHATNTPAFYRVGRMPNP